MDMTMKKIFLYITVAALGLAGLNSCNDFGDMNVDPEHLGGGNLNYNLLFTGAQAQALSSIEDIWRNGLIYSANMLQHTTSVEWAHGVFYTYRTDFNDALFRELYSSNDRGAIREIINVLNEWKDASGLENDYQIARILKAYMFQRMTDLYGDIPYSEVGRLAEGIGYPKYDTQEYIYNDLLKELDEAQAAISGSTSQLGAHDVYYKGDASKWKKFANSLMLRVAMRLSKVDPAKAETWVKKAVANGLFASVDDNAMLLRTRSTASDESGEPYGKVLADADKTAFHVSETFVNLLKNKNDPRLPFIATVCKHPDISVSQSDFEKGDPDPAKQIGMPVGYDKNGGQWDISTAPGYPGEGYDSIYSLVSRYTYADPKAPTMIVTHAENQLLLAEAAVRGWVSGSAEEYYNNGVKAAMQQFKFYNGIQELSGKGYNLGESEINTYLTANPFSTGSDDDKLEQINTQYYITTFCDEYEAFANWRRSGYPVLTPVDNTGYPTTATSSTIPRRFTYPASEAQSNEANYLEAVRRLNNGDKMNSRVWWDKE
jgi:hypothetical protein